MSNPEPSDPPAPTPDQMQAQFNTMFSAAMDKYLEDHKPAENKTKQPKSILDQLFGS